jgi:hypothetical protein
VVGLAANFGVLVLMRLNRKTVREDALNSGHFGAVLSEPAAKTSK